MTRLGIVAQLLGGLLLTQAHAGSVVASVTGQELVVAAPRYRLRLARFTCDPQLELRDAAGRWRPVLAERGRADFALVDPAGVHISSGAPARVRHAARADRVEVGLTTILGGSRPATATVHFLCTADGILVRFALAGDPPPAATVVWPLPRLLLAEPLFDAYAFWRQPDELRTGRIADLGDHGRYIGVSPWGQRGDVTRRLSARHPAILARGEKASVALGLVFLRYGTDWAGSFSFIQRHTPAHLYLYPAHAKPEAAAKGLWAWLAPFPASDPAASAAKVERLLRLGEALRRNFQPVAPQPDPEWTRPIPDFPAELRRPKPVADIRDAAVYTINEYIHSDYGIELARKAGSDVLIRGWFKWHNAPDWAKFAPLVPKAHALGALFGGGITCSALYHGENRLSEAQVLDMATRGPDGKLVDAWDTPGCRHGSLSNHRYLDYLFSWCEPQIDAGADYLFMDEINAALQANEGFDDHSLRDFRSFLIARYCDAKGWTRTDPRWRDTLKIDLADPAVCPDATIATFHYRAWLKARGLVAKPLSSANQLVNDWHAFRHWRDDKAWKQLTDRIRAYAASKGRRVLLSANGLARYVDLQVLGVWGEWRTEDGRVDLAESQIQTWGATVAAGWARAGRRVPVVLFHDWGFGGFPWLKISPADRCLWMRVRGAEIYAAGGFFAFPVLGPWSQDARRDGTLREIQRQTRFYQRHRRLYLGARVLGFEPLPTSAPHLSLALWRRDDPPALLLHVINRQAADGQPTRRTDIAVTLPSAARPKAVRIVSPDWPGEKPGDTRTDGKTLTVTIPQLEAYAVAILDYDALPDLSLGGRRIVPTRRWERPDRNEFVVDAQGMVADTWALNGFLQGTLHTHLRNPPTFLVHLPKGGALHVHIRSVATLGARLQCLIDGKPAKSVDLPDRDGKNDSSTPAEYGATFAFRIPPGRHRVTLHNIGGDWATAGWYAFTGEVGHWME